jgi:hypothetical protein
MIETEIREKEDVIIATPKGVLSAGDVKSLAARINDYINSHDRVPNLVLHTVGLPHWNDFAAFREHLKLVRDHHKVIRKVAVVSDSTLIGVIRPVVDQFTGAKVRRFPERALDDAVNWATMEEDHPGEFVQIEGLPNDVVGIDAYGLITARDYEDTLIPLIQSKLETQEAVKVIFVAGKYFDGFSGGAIWDDARLGLMHLRSFSKLAVVTDVDWLRHSAKLFGPLIPAEVMVFDLEDLDDAKAWIAT